MSHTWMQSLRRASFRGVHFWVETDQIDTGRRLVVHQYPLRDDPYVEDMGRDANKVKVKAYLSGADAGEQEKRLRRACEAAGPAGLSLPLEQLRAFCEKCSRDYSRDKLGFIAFQIDFVLEGGGAGPLPAAFLARMAAVAQPLAMSAAISLLVEGYQTIGAASWVADAGEDEIVAIARAIDTARAEATLEPVKGVRLAGEIRDTIRTAATLAAAGDLPDRIQGRAFMQSAQVVSPAPIAERIFDHIETIRTAGQPDDVIRVLAPLTVWDADATARSTAQRSSSASREHANRLALGRVTRLAAITATVIAMTERDYPDRRSAIQARADIVELIGGEIDELEGIDRHEVFVALSELRRRAVDFLSRAIIDLAPVTIVESDAILPSLYWANALYGSADRAGELARLNGVFHPGFMPTSIEARH